MKKLRRILFLALMVGLLACLCCQPAFAAVTEEEVQAQVDAVGKEAVSGNVLIWFMCAIGFLKVSQKIDSFMASLGVNVGHTGGSMLAEAMIAARGFSGFKSFSSHHFGGGHSSNSTHVNAGGGGKGGGFGAGFASGGLAGVIGRKVTNNAVKTATTPSETKASGLGGLVGGAAGGIGGHIYTSSVSKGGNFANNVIGSVATGNITQMGTISGEKAVDALTWGTLLWKLALKTFPNTRMLRSAAGVSQAPKLPPSIRRVSFSECIMQISMLHPRANTQRFIPPTVRHGISNTLLTL